MSDESWHVVRNIRGVTGFVGPGSKPVPLTDEEVASISIETRAITLNYNVGDSVKIKSGTLSGFIGRVEEISEDKKKIKVMATIFGRETPVELDSDSVEILEV
jgi:transcriptional antiterminator NusG